MQKQKETLSSVLSRLSLPNQDQTQQQSIGLHPHISVIIPTYNNAYNIHRTIESVLAQQYPHFEILVVDAESTDRTLAIVNRYDPEKVRVYSVTEHEVFAMLNRGVALATGLYATFLFPGDFYLTQHAFHQISYLAREAELPDLVYSGARSREGGEAPVVTLGPLSKDLLEHAVMPTRLQACWFRLDTLLSLGKFDSQFDHRGGFNLLCRFCRHPGLRHTSSERILVETEQLEQTNLDVALQAAETVRILYRNFGWSTALRWVIGQRHLHLLSLWLKEGKLALLRKR